MENQKPQKINNLAKGERIALQELIERDGIVITKANKSGTVVIINVKDHIREAESPLKKKHNCNRLKFGPAETRNILANDTFERFKEQKIMKEKVTKGLKTENCKNQNSIHDLKYIKMEALVAQ